MVFAGCQTTPKPIFPEVSPPIVWPPPPDEPRVRYIGALSGEADLQAQPSGWEAFQAVVAGPRAKVEFSRPTAVAVAEDVVFVADTGLGVVHRLDLDRREYTGLTGNPEDAFRVPIDLLITPERRLLVVDRGRGAIDVLDFAGTWQSTHRFDTCEAPVSIAYDAEHDFYWLLDALAHAAFTTRDWASIHQVIGRRGSAPGELNFPTGIATHPSVGVVIADAMNFRVQVFDDAGQPVAVFGQKGDAAGDFARPRDVAYDSDGHIYVVDNQFENVQIFDATGRLLLAIGGGGQGPGRFALPSGITIDSRDRIWIADSYNHRVQVLEYLPAEPAEEAP